MERAALVNSSSAPEDIRTLGGEEVKFTFDRSGHHRAYVGPAAAAEMRKRPRLYLLGADAENCFRDTFGAAQPKQFREWLFAQAKHHPKEVAGFCQGLTRKWKGREGVAGIAEYSRELDGVLAECRGGLERRKTIDAVKGMADGDNGEQEEKKRREAAEHLAKQKRLEARDAAVAAAKAARVKIPAYPEGASLYLGEDGDGDPILCYAGADGARRALTGEGEWVDADAASDDLQNMKALNPRERIIAEVCENADPDDNGMWRSDDKIKVRKVREWCSPLSVSEADIDAAWTEFRGSPLTRADLTEWKAGDAGENGGAEGGAPSRADVIISSIMDNADPDNPDHWRSDGGISVLKVEEWFGDSSPTEEEIADAWAGFADDPLTRENFRQLKSEQGE